uniref:Ig-like domain-containing protein n=1 Tax=Varanus komodoensis TaxID=61221 RepID=A0A8D2LKJ1_VARKO
MGSRQLRLAHQAAGAWWSPAASSTGLKQEAHLFSGPGSKPGRQEIQASTFRDITIQRYSPREGGGRCLGISIRLEAESRVQPRYPKPTISVSPSEVVALGGHVTVHCKSQGYAGMEFSLCKEGSASVDCRSTKVAAVEEVAFSIVDAQQSDGGTYRCIYHSKSDEGPWWSDYSDEVHINVTGEGLTQSLPSGQPALSMNVTIECQGPEKGLHFILLKSRERKASQWAEEDRSTAEFPLSLMSPEDAGTYACQYHRKGKRFLLSEPSDPVELRLRGERLALLSSHQPRPPERGVQPVWSYLWSKHYKHYERPTFYFFKEGTPGRLQVKWKKPLFPFRRAQFYIPNAQPGDGGTYWCAYLTTPLSPRCSLFPLDPTLSRPSIRIRPKPQISLGLNATIECQGPEYYFHLTFFLFKSGNLIASQKEEPMKNTTQFLLSSVRLEDAGSYSCRYQRIVPFAQSEPSDAVELTVTGEGCAQHGLSPLRSPPLH